MWAPVLESLAYLFVLLFKLAFAATVLSIVGLFMFGFWREYRGWNLWSLWAALSGAIHSEATTEPKPVAREVQDGTKAEPTSTGISVASDTSLGDRAKAYAEAHPGLMAAIHEEVRKNLSPDELVQRIIECQKAEWARQEAVQKARTVE